MCTINGLEAGQQACATGGMQALATHLQAVLDAAAERHIHASVLGIAKIDALPQPHGLWQCFAYCNVGDSRRRLCVGGKRRQWHMHGCCYNQRQAVLTVTVYAVLPDTSAAMFPTCDGGLALHRGRAKTRLTHSWYVLLLVCSTSDCPCMRRIGAATVAATAALHRHHTWIHRGPSLQLVPPKHAGGPSS